MNAARRERIDAIVGQANTPESTQREQFLDEAGAGDTVVRTEVENQLGMYRIQPVAILPESGGPGSEPASGFDGIDSIALNAVTIPPNSNPIKGRNRLLKHPLRR